MKIILDCLGIDRPGGGRTVALGLLRLLPKAAPDIQFVVLLTRPEPSLDGFPNLRQRVGGPKGMNAIRLWIEAALPMICNMERPDLVHHFRNTSSLIAPAPYLVTVHDLSALTRSDLYPAYDRWYYRFVEPRLLSRATKVIAVSKNTAREVVEMYGLSDDRIGVIYHGIDPSYRLLSADETRPVLSRYRLEPGYLLHVGSVSKRKNLAPLVRAVGRLHQSRPTPPLVLVGRDYHKMPDPEFEAAAQELGRLGALRRLGEVPAEDLPYLLAGAGLFVFPSHHEGFGLAPLEAAACGVPVLASLRLGLSEAMGDAAFDIVNPSDPTELADGIERLLGDPALRADLSRRGLAQAARFSWEKSATKHAGLYRECAGA